MASERMEQEIVRLEERYWQALKNKDLEAALRLTDEPCIVTGAQGVASIDKRKFREMMNQNNHTLKDFKLKDAQVRVLSDDVAILAYQVHEDLVVDGRPMSLDAAESSTWIRRPEGWVCAMHTESMLGDPFGRDRQNSGDTVV